MSPLCFTPTKDAAKTPKNIAVAHDARYTACVLNHAADAPPSAPIPIRSRNRRQDTTITGQSLIVTCFFLFLCRNQLVATSTTPTSQFRYATPPTGGKTFGTNASSRYPPESKRRCDTTRRDETRRSIDRSGFESSTHRRIKVKQSTHN